MAGIILMPNGKVNEKPVYLSGANLKVSELKHKCCVNGKYLMSDVGSSIQ